MKLLATAAELKAIRTICSGTDRISAFMVSSLVEESFYYKPAAEAFKFIHNRLRTQGDVPDWTGLTGDPSISEDTRKILRSSKEEPAISKAKVQSIVDTLEKYRKLRALVEMAQGVLDRIEDKELDLDDLVEDTTNKLTAARQRGDTGTALHHIGKGNNTVGLLKEMLYGKKKPSVPTGFKAFDDRNGGILLGSLWTIGANTGGGKTAMAVNVLRNMTEFALEDCCIVPLEMTATQTLDRLAGILSGQDVNKISQKRLSSGEKSLVKTAYKKYVQTLKSNKTVYSIYEPPEDVTIEEVLLTLKPRGYKVILIDYISLLKGADGDDQWKQLGRIARFAKVFAKNNNCIVVLLCQVSEEGRIRYANAIAEHSNNAWIWTLPGEESETSIMDIKQLKARNQLRFNFQLISHNSSMRITDLDDGPESEVEDDDQSDNKTGYNVQDGNKNSSSKRRKDKGAGKSSTDEEPYLKDLNDGEESEDDEDD